MVIQKSILLKPQDLVVALKICANEQQDFVLQTLSTELGLAISVVHGCITRCEASKLLSRSSGSLRANRHAVREFTIHGARYAFPALLGSLTRGMPTAVAGPILSPMFEHGTALPPVWPTANGTAYGPGVQPLHPCVPTACETDAPLYALLTLLDALRVGAAREQAIAMRELEDRLS